MFLVVNFKSQAHPIILPAFNSGNPYVTVSPKNLLHYL